MGLDGALDPGPPGASIGGGGNSGAAMPFARLARIRKVKPPNDAALLAAVRGLVSGALKYGSPF